MQKFAKWFVHIFLKREASLIFPNFTISVFSSSSLSRFFVFSQGRMGCQETVRKMQKKDNFMNCAVHRNCKIWGTILDSPEKTGRFFLENYDDGLNIFTTVSRENTNFTKNAFRRRRGISVILSAELSLQNWAELISVKASSLSSPPSICTHTEYTVCRERDIQQFSL